jgi:hypothetical protein
LQAGIFTVDALRDVPELATVTALPKGGTVYVLPAGEVPSGSSAAAVFRYSAPVLEVVTGAATGGLGDGQGNQSPTRRLEDLRTRQGGDHPRPGPGDR